MRSEFGRLGRATLVYGLAGVFSRAVGFLLLPVLTAFLSPSDFGVAGLLSVLGFLLSSVASLGVEASLGPCYFQSAEAGRRSAAVWTAVGIAAVVAVAIAIAAGLGSRAIAAFLLRDPSLASLVGMTLAGAACGLLTAPISLYLRFEERAGIVLALAALTSVASAAAAVVLVALQGRGVRGWVEAGLLGQAVSLAGHAAVAPWRRIRFDRRVADELLRVGLPFVPGGLCIFALVHANKLLLERLAGVESLGIYNVGFGLGAAMALPIASFQSAWFPFFMPWSARQDEAAPLFGRIATYFVVGFGSLALIFFVAARPVVLLVTSPTFHAAWCVVGLVATSELLRGIFYLVLPPLYFQRDLRVISWIQAGAAAGGIAFNVVLIPVLGIRGAAVGLVLGFLLLPVLVILRTRKQGGEGFRPRYEKRRLVRFAGVFALIAGLASIPRSWPIGVEGLLAAAGAVLVIVAAGSLLDPRERRAAMERLSVLRRKRGGVPDPRG